MQHAEETEQQVKDAVKIYKKFFDMLGIPYSVSKRPEWDKFPGALYTVAFDTIMPDGKTFKSGLYTTWDKHLPKHSTLTTKLLQVNMNMYIKHVMDFRTV